MIGLAAGLARALRWAVELADRDPELVEDILALRHDRQAADPLARERRALMAFAFEYRAHLRRVFGLLLPARQDPAARRALDAGRGLEAFSAHLSWGTPDILGRKSP